MFLFVISVRSKGSLLYYKSIWDTVDSTLHSILGQTDDRYHVAVVCEDNESKLYPSHDKITYVHHNFLNDHKLGNNRLFNYYTAPESQLDLGCKNALALFKMKHLSPKYVFFLDAADFVHNKIVERALSAETTESGWEIKLGMALRNFRYRSEFNMPQITGSTHILNYAAITRNFSFEKIESSDLSINSFCNLLHPFYLREVLGGSCNYEAFFHNKKFPVEQWPYAQSIVYNMGYTQLGSSKIPGMDSNHVWSPVLDEDGELATSLIGYNIPDNYIHNPYVPSR